MIIYNYIDKLVSAIKNDVVSGLSGFHTNLNFSDELIAQDVVDERLQIIKEYSLKGIMPLKDLYISINCIKVDCKNIEKCHCGMSDEEPVAHFEIPQLLNDYGNLSIDYLGSTDRQLPFVFYTSSTAFRYHKYRKRGKNKPYVWIDTTPNENGMNDCFICNAPFIDKISITAIFKDLRQLSNYECCLPDDNMTFINNEIKKRVTEKKIRYYRQLQAPTLPNNQVYTA